MRLRPERERSLVEVAKGTVMLLGKNWKIESDELNITLYERHEPKKAGREYWRAHSYYSSVASALKGLVNINISRSGLRDLETVNLKIEELHRLIEKISPSLTAQHIIRNVTACKKAIKTSKE